MTIYLKNKYRLQVDDFTFKCCIGKGGISKEKKEGDKKTPFGSYHIEHLYFRKDKIIKPFAVHRELNENKIQNFYQSNTLYLKLTINTILFHTKIFHNFLYLKKLSMAFSIFSILVRL